MEFLYWICLSGVLFGSFICPFIFMSTNVAWYPGENDAIIFRVFILSRSHVMRGIDVAFFWSLSRC